MNSGKKFEANFKASVPDNVFYYRFRDGTSSWSKQEGTRFQAKNICDCMLFNGNYLYLLELKSHKNKSLPLSAIRENQIKSLIEADEYKNVIAGFVVNFADVEETYFMNIALAEQWYNNGERKSIPIKAFRDTCILIDSIKLKTNYRYDIRKFLNDYGY